MNHVPFERENGPQHWPFYPTCPRCAQPTTCYPYVEKYECVCGWTISRMRWLEYVCRPGEHS